MPTQAYKEIGADIVTGAETGVSAEEQQSTGINVGDVERRRSIFAGALLVALVFLKLDLRSKLGLLLGGMLIQRGVTGRCGVYRRLRLNTAGADSSAHGLKFEKVIRVERPARELFGFWRHLENLPRIMPHLESVQEKSERVSHWIVKGPAGKRLEWDAEIISEHPGEMIAWQSLPGAAVQNAGTVRFKAVDGATEVKVAMQYSPPGGGLGAAVSALLGHSPEKELEEDLNRFKLMMEQRV